MKKFLALFTALSLLAFAGSASAVTVNATPASVFVIVGNSATATVTGTAAHNGTLTYEKTGGPAWAEFVGNTITFVPNSTVTDGSYTVTITVTETYLEDPSAAGHSEPTERTETGTGTVTAIVYNIKPIALSASAPSAAVTAGTTTGSITFTSAAANGGSIVYTLVSGPTWATLSGNTLTFEPDAAVNAGTYPVAVRATETYTLADGVQRTATSSVITVNAVVAAFPVPVVPVTSKDEEGTGNEESKTSEAAVATETKTVTKVVTTTKTETKTVTVQTFSDTAVAAAKVVTTVTKEETTQTVTQVTEKLKVTTTAASTTAANSVVETITQTITTTTTKVTATEAATQFLAALTAPSSTGVEEDTSTKASKQAIATSLFKGKTEESGTTAPANTSFLASKAKAKADGTQETPAETFLRVVEETLNAAARILTASNPTTTAKLQSMFMSTTTTTTTTTVQVVDSTVLQNASVTNADGTETDEAPAFEDVMAQLAQQAQQEVDDTEAGTAAATKADTKLAEVQQEAPVAVTAPVSLPDDAEPSVAILNMPPQKPDMYGKKIRFRALKQAKGSRFNTAVFSGAEADGDEDGSGTFLNSAGQSIDTIPGEGQWVVPEGETEEVLVIPGQIHVAMLMKPGMVYTPVVTTPATELATIEGVSTTSEEKTVSVDVTTVEEVAVVVPVYDANTYSTKFNTELEVYFKTQGYDTEVGEFIVPGEDGVFTVATEADTSMLARTNRAVVRTLPMIAPVGNTASDMAQYVMRVRYDIPLDTDTMAVSSADTVLAFWPNALTTTDANGTVTTAQQGDALFLNETGTGFLTADMVRQIAKGELGEAIDENTQGYVGYVVMSLAKLSDDADPYKPVITVKREAVVTPEPGPESGDQPGPESGDQPGPGPDQPVTTTLSLSASASTIVMELGETERLTLSAANVDGTASYTVDAPAAAGVTLSGTTATITPTAAGSYTLRFTVTDSGRTTNNTATASVALTVTDSGSVEPEIPTGTVGSSGGGCDSGFGALALALLGGLIARKK